MTQRAVTLGFEVERKGETPSFVQQVHGACYHEVIAGPVTAIAEADAVVTKMAGLSVHIFTADCLPVLLYQERFGVAAVHCGWRGALRGVVRETLAWFEGTSGIRAVLGPSIHQCCFEVKGDFVREFENGGKDISPYLQTRGGKMFFDLPGYVVEVELAFPREAIDLTYSRCTFCSSPRLPSYRRNRGTDPRIRAWISRSG